MSDAENDKSSHRLRQMRASTQLARQHQNEEALRLVDDAIAIAIDQKNSLYVRVLSQHVAIISKEPVAWPINENVKVEDSDMTIERN